MEDEKPKMDESNEISFAEQQRKQREQKRDQINPSIGYPNTFKPMDSAAQLLAKFPLPEDENTELTELDQQYSLAGRAMALRQMGKAFFIDLHDQSGKFQLYINQKQVTPEVWDLIMSLDLGDIIGVVGHLFFTRTKMLTLHVEQIELITKCLYPMPEKFSGLKDTETQYRQRYLHLATESAARSLFQLRSKVIQSIRNNLWSREYIEVETPMMHNIQGGAAAKPFTTHYNALDRDFYLRVAPELHLKRLLVGGLNKVFELNRNFRNEGISTKHSPEFTMLEWYTSYSDYRQAMDLTEEVLRDSLQTPGVSADICAQLNIDFQRESMVDLVASHCSLTVDEVTSNSFIDFVQQFSADTNEWGAALIKAFEKFVEPNLIKPTFVHSYPASQSPLARPNDSNPKIADRWELFIAGHEIANGYSELNDPTVQAQYFDAQKRANLKGDAEAMGYDADYIVALSYGMPPAAGVGIGIDRWIMLITGKQSIRDVLLFPHLKF